MTMVKICQHPGPDLLLKHAMGQTTEAESLILSCHLSYCKACKAEINKYEKIGGYYLNHHEELKVSKDLWKQILMKVECLDQEYRQSSYSSYSIISSLTENSIKIPSFLYDYLDKNNTKHWKSAMNNVRYSNIAFKDKNVKGRLIEIPANKTMPKHGHESSEVTLVLHGGYSDEKGHYNKGDLIIADSNEVHSPVADEETGCLCLVVYTGSIQFKGLLGSILNLSNF